MTVEELVRRLMTHPPKKEVCIATDLYSYPIEGVEDEADVDRVFLVADSEAERDYP